MAQYAVQSGFDATISGGQYDGLNANRWAQQVFVPASTPRMVGITVAVVVGLWEFCALFPAEVVLWQRVSKRGMPSRSSFAPWTTLTLRYVMLCYSVTIAFVEWSNSMPSDAACRTAYGFLLASWSALVVVCSFAIAWRAQAVTRGIIENRATVLLMQVVIAVLVLMQVFMAIFTAVWGGVHDHLFQPVVRNGQCTAGPYLSSMQDSDYNHVPQPRHHYVADVLLWYWVFLILFNLCCLLLVIFALRTLATRSRGFSKFINGMRNHSVFYFAVVLLLSIMCIVWRKVQNAAWIVRPTTVVEAAIMIRILLAEQNAARRPVDTTYMDQRHFSTRGYPAHNDVQPVTYPRDPTIHFADRMQGMRRRSVDGAAQDVDSVGTGASAERHGNHGAATAAHHAAMAMRPIYQPYSMMDNLGQAFSQVDSRNPHDIDGQSVDYSNRPSLEAGQNIYPGVEVMEERQRRMLLEAKLAALGKPYNVHDVQELVHRRSLHSLESGRPGLPHQTSDFSVKEVLSEKADHANHTPISNVPAAASTPAAVAQPVRQDAFERHLRRRSQDQARNDDQSDESDEELGIQTVHF